MKPPARRNLLAIAVLAASLAMAAAGLGLKVLRYAAPPVDHASALAARIADAAALRGWQPTAIRPDGRETFPWHAFAKEGCPEPLIVAVLKPGGELTGLARAIYGPDIALVAAGEAGSTLVASRMRGLLGGLGPAAAPAELAIQRPHRVTGACATPSAADWRNALIQLRPPSPDGARLAADRPAEGEVR